MKLARSLSVLALVFCAILSHAQTSQTPPAATQTAPATSAAKTPDAKPEDVKSVDAIVAALYDVISGPAGTRDWDRFRSLFAPEGRLIPNNVNDKGEWTHPVLSVEDFVKRAGANMEKNGFFEKGIANKSEQYGTVAHVFGTYESRHEKDGKPFARGINSFSLSFDGKRWYVVQILWQSETPAFPIPEKYLPK